MTSFSATLRPSRVARAQNPTLCLSWIFVVLAASVSLAQTTGQNISGPTPWIDVTTFGAKGDAKLNVTGTTTSGSTTLSVSGGSPTSFSLADVGKAISVNGAGLAAPGSSNIPTGSLSSGGGLNCGTGVILIWQATFIKENGTRVTSESAATPESSSLSCPGPNNQLTLSAPPGTVPSGATAWLPYVAYVSGGELFQAISGSAGHCTSLSTGGNGCALTSTWISGTSANLLFDTSRPPASPVLLTTIASVTNLTTVALTDAASQTISGNANVAWGTDNSSALTSAINSCIEAAQLVVSNFGCRVFVPGPTAISTGRYFVASGIVVTTANGLALQDLTILGGGSYGSGDVGPAYPPVASAVGGVGASAEIVGSGRFPLITLGAFGVSNVNGLNVINIGFRDTALNSVSATSASTSGNTWGGIRLINVTRPFLQNVNAMNFGIGYGIEIEGDPASGGIFTQVGAIQNSNCSLCRIGIWAPQAVSDIQVQGGTYSGPGATSSPSYPSYGVDFETSQSGSTTGSIRIVGTAFRNNSTAAVNLFDCQGCQVITIKGEQVAASPFVGIGVQADGTTHCTGDVVVGGGLANYATGVKITSNCSNPLLLLPPLTSVTTAVSNNASTPIELSGANGLMLRGSSVSTPTTAGQFSYNNANSQFVGGLGGTTGIFPTFAGANPTSGDCAKWVAAGQLADAGSPCATPNNAAIFFWCTGNFTAATTAFLFPGPNGQGCGNTVGPTAGMPLPFAGTLKNLQVVVGAAGTSATGETVTLFKNGSSTSLACTLVMITTCSNTGTNVSVAAGDTIYIQVTVPTGDTLVKDMRLGVQLQ